MDTLTDLMVYAGIAIMLVNIVLYVRFWHFAVRNWGWKGTGNTLQLPIVLLALFLAGYIAVAVIGKYNVIMASILFGGSIFVYLILRFLKYMAGQVVESEQLKVELRAAEKANTAKTIFLSNMSHDIRTPLNAIIGYADLAKRDYPDSEVVTGYVNKIAVSGRQLLDILNDVLEMSKIESGKMELVETVEDPVKLTENVCGMFTDQMHEKGIAYSFESYDITEGLVMCDKVRYSRILINLIGNALKFTNSGGSVDVSLRETSADEDSENMHSEDMHSEDMRSFELIVKDTGIGMTEEFAARVFESFERERSSTVSGIQGTGLGMAITKNIVDLMGGTIEVGTVKGEGTEFKVRFALKKADSPETEERPAYMHDRSEADHGKEKCSCGRRILLAEDVEMNREIAVMLLTDMGLCVETATNGKEAVDIIASSAPGYFDAVLMDIQMPVLDGYEATRQIRALDDPVLSSIPIAAITANAFAEDRSKAFEAGMNGHITKPLDIDEVRRTLAGLIGERKDS